MDIRVKTLFWRRRTGWNSFARSTASRARRSCLTETGVYPLLRRVRYNRSDLALEISLVLSYMGEEYVATSLVTEDRPGSVRRTQIGSSTAHTGYQMRRALDHQAEAVRRVLREQIPPSRD